MDEKIEDVDVLIEGWEEGNITSSLTKWNEIHNIKKQLEKLEEMIKNDVKAYLKQRNWKEYKDKESDISVSITNFQKRKFDEKKLRDFLSSADFAQVVSITTVERMCIFTPEARKRLNKYVR